MADDFAPMTGIDWKSSAVGVVQYGGGDKNMVCLFYNKPKHNPQKSTEMGRPIYEDTTYVRMHAPGDRLNIVDRPATPNDARRFPAQWQQFSQNKEQVPEGTPIDLLYPEHPSVGATLRAYGVHTVEQCAELSGVAIDAIGMGAQRYSNDSKQYLEASNKGVKASQLRHELEERDSQIRTLNTTVESLKGQLAHMQKLMIANAGMETDQMVAGQQTRPVFPRNAPKQMVPEFDAQTAQINATHVTRDAERAAAKKRERTRLKG